MKAIAVTPGKPNSVHQRETARPSIDSIKDGRGVLVRVLKVGVDATDKEINDALYGQAPPRDDFLILGHESFGIVEEVGPAVRHVAPGDFVTATVRRPGPTLFDLIGINDMTSHETYYERGINLLHGYMTEYFVDDAEFIVKMPRAIKHLHVLAEPMSCVAKAIEQAYEIQRRMLVWRPERAFVMGAGQIGLLATLALRLRGLEVYTMARTEPPVLKSEIVAAFGADYVSAKTTSVADLADDVGAPDLIIEATGNSQVVFDAMGILARNGVLVCTSVTGGNRMASVPSDKINLDFVLGNKVLVGSVNGNRNHFEQGIRDLAIGDMEFPGVVPRILTNPVDGLDQYQEMMRLLVDDAEALKVYVNVAEE